MRYNTDFSGCDVFEGKQGAQTRGAEIPLKNSMLLDPINAPTDACKQPRPPPPTHTHTHR